MAKYSDAFKEQLVQEYLQSPKGYRRLAKKYGIPSMSPINEWVDAYRHLGPDGLKRKRKKHTDAGSGSGPFAGDADYHTRAGQVPHHHSFGSRLALSAPGLEQPAENQPRACQHVPESDLSPMENFFGLLKQEMYYGKELVSYEELKHRLETYIHYYNHDRIKLKLAGQSPVNYRTSPSQLTAS